MSEPPAGGRQSTWSTVATLRLELLGEELEPDVDRAQRLVEAVVERHRAPSRVGTRSGRSATAAKRAAWALDGNTSTPAARS